MTKLEIKHTSTLNEIKDETFMISQSITNNIALKLQRKIKDDQKLQKFIIVEICNEQLQEEVDQQFSQWQSTQKNNTKLRQRDIDQTKQNIIFNVLINALKMKGIQIESFEQKKSEKVISRRRIASYDGMSQEETRVIGERMNRVIVNELKIECGMKKKDCVKVIDHLNLNNLNNVDILNHSNEIEIQQLEEVQEDTVPSDEISQEMNQLNNIGMNQMKYVQLPIQQVPTENGMMNIITLNNINYYCELTNDQFGNLTPIIPIQDENGNWNYQSVVYDVASQQFVMVPYCNSNYVTVPVIQNNSNCSNF